jgi:hypothetical protein
MKPRCKICKTTRNVKLYTPQEMLPLYLEYYCERHKPFKTEEKKGLEGVFRMPYTKNESFLHSL